MPLFRPSRLPAALTGVLRGLAAAAVALALTGCGAGKEGWPGGDGGRLLVVTTTTHLADFARNLGGDRVEVRGMLKPNVDAHDYEPSPADIDALARADVLVENGVGLEAWLHDTIEAAGFDGERVDASRGVRLLIGGEGEHADEGGAEGGEAGGHADEDGGEHGPYDPHIWQSPANAKVMVANIERALVRADPAGAAVYEANHDRYARQLDQLDAEIARQIAPLPDKRIVTNHDAFRYYIDRYGLEFVGSIIPSFDSSAELSAREAGDLVRRIRATGVRAVFSETSLPPDTAETIASEAGVEVVAGEGGLYGDSLGPPGSAGATYIDAMRHNTRVIVESLS